MGLDNIISYTITVDMESGQCDINYPMDTDLTELEMIRNLCGIAMACYEDLRSEYE